MQITRRVYDRKKSTVKNIIVNADLIKENARTVIVRLANGDVIKRRKSDIVRG